MIKANKQKTIPIFVTGESYPRAELADMIPCGTRVVTTTELGDAHKNFPELREKINPKEKVYAYDSEHDWFVIVYFLNGGVMQVDFTTNATARIAYTRLVKNEKAPIVNQHLTMTVGKPIGNEVEVTTEVKKYMRLGSDIIQ
jgi:hypothetical protein